jgi:hypothetical protein
LAYALRNNQYLRLSGAIDHQSRSRHSKAGLFVQSRLPPFDLSKLTGSVKYWYFDFDMSFVTALHASTAGFQRGVGDVTKTEVFVTRCACAYWG